MNSVLLLLLHILVVFLAVATLLAVLFPRRPLLGVSQHWGLQLWQLGLLAAIGGFWLMDWAAVAVAAVTAAYWSWRLWPRKATADAIESKPTLRLVSANLLYQNLDHERAAQAIAAMEADVVVLCEVTPDALARVRRLGFAHMLDTCVPETPYGIVILSRFPLALRSSGIGEDPMPRHLAADLSVGGRTIGLVAIHPTNPLRISRAHRIPGEFDAVADLLRAAQANAVLVGDCNAAGWSSYLRELERTASLRNDGRMRPSWPIWLPSLIRLPLDHVWVRGELVLVKAGLGPKFGSDHLPLIAEIGWRDK